MQPVRLHCRRVQRLRAAARNWEVAETQSSLSATISSTKMLITPTAWILWWWEWTARPGILVHWPDETWHISKRGLVLRAKWSRSSTWSIISSPKMHNAILNQSVPQLDPQSSQFHLDDTLWGDWERIRSLQGRSTLIMSSTQHQNMKSKDQRLLGASRQNRVSKTLLYLNIWRRRNLALGNPKLSPRRLPSAPASTTPWTINQMCLSASMSQMNRIR